jgi:hypothetical protein
LISHLANPPLIYYLTQVPLLRSRFEINSPVAKEQTRLHFLKQDLVFHDAPPALIGLLRLMPHNQKEITHGRVSWQPRLKNDADAEKRIPIGRECLKAFGKLN